MKRALFAGITILLFTAVKAIDTDIAFEDPELQARYEAIIDEHDEVVDLQEHARQQARDSAPDSSD